jgi:ABC-2 type transport system permease protein
VFLVFRREFLERIRSRSFRLSTIGILLLAGAAIVAVDKAPSLFGGGTETLGLVSEADTPEVRQALLQAADQQDLKLKVVDLANEDAATTSLRAGDVDAFLAHGQLTFKSKENTSLTLAVNRALFEVHLPDILNSLGISLQDASQLLKPQLVAVRSLEPTRSDEEERRVVASIATIGLYLVLVLYGNWILQGVVEEKTSRVVEVLLGLLQPSDLLAGKTMGILASVLVQLAFGIAGAVAGLIYVGASVLPNATPDVVGASIAYLLPGIVLYSLIYAAVGATASRQAEAESAALPVTFVLLVPYMLSLTVVSDAPDSGLAQVLSMVPLTSPLIMPTRVALGSPSVLDLTISYALLWPSIVAVAWIGGQIYSNAILMSRSVRLAQLLSMVGRAIRGSGAQAS